MFKKYPYIENKNLCYLSVMDVSPSFYNGTSSSEKNVDWERDSYESLI